MKLPNLHATSGAHAHVLVTGCTGFVGKVVLEELMRRRVELGIERAYILVRTKRGQDPEQRFQTEIAASQCFSLLTEDWTARCHVVAGELSQPDCGLTAADVALLQANVTHIIHCAASVEFDLPVADAAAANITSALHMLDLAKGCARLVQMVSVSTAYVTPHVSDTTPVLEALVQLPFDPQQVYEQILAGKADQKALMAQTGHPNTYTFTKCIAEHLLHRHKGHVPLCIVRPSVVSATWRHPFPAWIDSAAALAGFVLLIGSGHMRVLAANPSSRLDIVPCDVVSDRVISAAFGPPVAWGVKYAVAGLAQSARVDTLTHLIIDFFRAHPVDRMPAIEHILAPSKAFQAHELRLHRVPTRLARTFFDLQGNKKMGKQARKLADKLKYVNRAFPYFTSNTFDFRASEPLTDPLFRREQYVETACLGVYRHLIKRDETQMSLGGRKHKDPLTDLQWALGQPHGNWAIRTFAFTVRKALRQCTSRVTFDRASFALAVAATPPGNLHVIIPMHRSYMDFLLCSYLFFARPDLGIRIPHIAAAEEFSRIPILGELFKKTHAFYLRRGIGKPDEELTRHVHDLVAKGETIQFFIEGARSRSRQFLAPRHGLLRCLQATRRSFTLLPISITYDRVPEEASLERELRGHPRPEMRLRSLLAWAGKLARGEVDLGRVHLTCGEPVQMGPDADVRAVSREVMAQLQQNTATSTHHLRCFLRHNAALTEQNVTVDWLRDAIETRGGLVIDSPLDVESTGQSDVDAVTELCMRYHWMHLLYPEAQALWPDHPAILHHTRQNGFHVPEREPGADLDDPRLRALLRALFEPVARDYAQVAERLGDPAFAPRHASARSLLHEAPDAHLPYLQAAFEDLSDRGIVVLDRQNGSITWGPQVTNMDEYKRACVWPEDRPQSTRAVRIPVRRAMGA